MQLFAALIEELNNTTKTNDKRDALLRYLHDAPAEDRIWLVALFTGRRPKRLVSSTLLKFWCMELTAVPKWLFDESYHTVGDLSEAIALLIPETKNAHEDITLAAIMHEVQRMAATTEEEKKSFIIAKWQRLSRSECLVFNKLMIGGFRIGVSEALVVQALAIYADKPAAEMAHVISGSWNPYEISFDALLNERSVSADESKPYPFYLAYAIDGAAAGLGAPEDWQVEWKWDGIRGQLICRQGKIYLWSRGEDLLEGRFPEIEGLLPLLPEGIVLDGEILAFRDEKPIAFQYLQTRITRKKVTKKQLDEAPVVFMVYDIIEHNGNDIRNTPMYERRALLEQIVSAVNSPYLILSEIVLFDDWDELGEKMHEVRERACEGFMIKRKSSVYGAGRRRGDWWKWKVDPLSVDAVLIYAQKGHGKRSNLYTDYTFAVRDGSRLVPFAKAYSGLTDKEIIQVDKFVRANAIEQFGPVKTVKAELVFEIGFEGIAVSTRHKSGVAVRFPRMLKWRTDKSVDEINTLEELKQLLEQYGKK